MTPRNEILLEERSKAETIARLSKVYTEDNSPTGKENLCTAFERVEKSNPGFGQRISAVLDARAAVHNLTLRDVIEHTRLGHLDERALEHDPDRMDDNIRGMIRAISKECGVCLSCARAATVVWIAMTMECDLGLKPPHLRVTGNETGSEGTRLEERRTARTGLATKLRVARIYEEFNYGSKEGPEDLHDTAMELLDQLKESNPGFCERIAAALTAEDLDGAVLGLTLQDIIDHTSMWHLNEQMVGDNAGTDSLWPDIRRMVEAISKECGVCVSCGRAVAAGWIARTVAWELGPRTTPDPLVMPTDGQASPSAAG